MRKALAFRIPLSKTVYHKTILLGNYYFLTYQDQSLITISPDTVFRWTLLPLSPFSSLPFLVRY